jgi:hypothetical protein
LVDVVWNRRAREEHGCKFSALLVDFGTPVFLRPGLATEVFHRCSQTVTLILLLLLVLALRMLQQPLAKETEWQRAEGLNVFSTTEPQACLPSDNP